MRKISILREIIIILLSLGIRVQSSSLWARLLTIPIRLSLVVSFGSDKFSGLLFFLFVIIFIGGLLVLLVRVATAVFQEQSSSINLLIFLLRVLVILILWTNMFYYEWKSSFRLIFSWVFRINLVYFRTSISLLLIRLLVISRLLSEFKGIIRKA